MLEIRTRNLQPQTGINRGRSSLNSNPGISPQTQALYLPLNTTQKGPSAHLARAYTPPKCVPRYIPWGETVQLQIIWGVGHTLNPLLPKRCFTELHHDLRCPVGLVGRWQVGRGSPPTQTVQGGAFHDKVLVSSLCGEGIFCIS